MGDDMERVGMDWRWMELESKLKSGDVQVQSGDERTR